MSAVQQELPLAFVDGKPITDMPQDLYIPPDALSVILEVFEGPLDLLLYLIRRQNMNILEIDVSEIARQYMEYINLAKTMRFELAAEYLLMAAMLAEIKSRMLLPKPETEDEQDEDPRAELIRRLQQYERFKQAADDLDALPRFYRELAPVNASVLDTAMPKVQPDVSMADLLSALNDVLRRSDRFEHHQIQREKLSTRERMSQILSQLKAGHFISFYCLFRPEEGRAGVVVTFLAIMELVKEQLVELVQAHTLAPIHLKARGL